MRYVITHPKGIEVVEMESRSDVELYSEAKYGKTMPVKKSRWRLGSTHWPTLVSKKRRKSLKWDSRTPLGTMTKYPPFN